MRISTALVSALVAGGSLSLSLQYANTQQQAAPTLDLAGLDETAVPQTPVPSATESPAPAEAQAADASNATTAPTETQAPNAPQATASSAPATSAAQSQPAQTQTQAPAPEPAPAPADKTVTSDVIDYKYGVVQISLTAVGTDITNVTLLQGDASYGRDVAYAALIDATIKTDGINYGNVSGATFTTEAFKKAVTNAIAKL